MIKIAILGPESTGKSTLAEALAKHFDTKWVPEFAREYIEKLNIPYNFDDVCNIAHKQIEQEIEIEKISSNGFVFFDTDLIITKVWFEYRFKKTPEFVTKWMQSHHFDLYLLCAPDLPWEFDPVREHSDEREFFFEWYKSEIEQIRKPYIIIDGTGNQRLKKAITVLDTLNKPPKQ